jgi:DNA-binding NarL/FixJ family response regulator
MLSEARVLEFERRDEPATWSDLTPREKEVCFLRVIHGLSYKEIAARTRLCHTSVSFHLSTAMRVLRVSNSMRLAYWMGSHAAEIFHDAEDNS